MSGRFFKIGVLAFVASIGLGLYMGIAHDHGFVTVHAHLALMGWVSMALFAIAYRFWPQLAAGWLPKAHFWLYTVGFVVTIVGLVLLERGMIGSGDPLSGIGSTINALGTLCFAAQALRADLTMATA